MYENYYLFFNIFYINPLIFSIFTMGADKLSDVRAEGIYMTPGDAHENTLAGSSCDQLVTV